MLSCEKNRDESLKVFSLDLTANYALLLILPTIQPSNLFQGPFKLTDYNKNNWQSWTKKLDPFYINQKIWSLFINQSEEF